MLIYINMHIYMLFGWFFCLEYYVTPIFLIRQKTAYSTYLNKTKFLGLLLMKTENWILLGGAAIAAYFLFFKKKDSSLSNDVLGADLGSVLDYPGQLVGGSYDFGKTIGSDIANFLNNLFSQPEQPSAFPQVESQTPAVNDWWSNLEPAAVAAVGGPFGNLLYGGAKLSGDALRDFQNNIRWGDVMKNLSAEKERNKAIELQQRQQAANVALNRAYVAFANQKKQVTPGLNTNQVLFNRPATFTAFGRTWRNY